MVPVNVILGAAGTAGFTFGLVRTRLAASRGVRTSAGSDDVSSASPEPVLDIIPTPTDLDSVDDL
jgi:hypothetical protein